MLRGGGGREVVSRPNLIVLNTWTVKWYLLTLFDQVSKACILAQLESIFLNYMFLNNDANWCTPTASEPIMNYRKNENTDGTWSILTGGI